jgi:hypothetical protein
VDGDDADARQVARQPRGRELRVLQEINPRLDPHRARRDDVHVLRDERPLLRARRALEGEHEGEGGQSAR